MILQDVFKSITKFEWYNYTINFPFKRSFKYLIFLLLLYSFIHVIFNAGKNVDSIYFYIKESMGGNFPEIIIEKGTITANVDQPYVRSFEKKFYVIVDTTGQTKEFPIDYPSGVLLQKDKIIFKKNYQDVRLFDISKINYFILNENRILSWKKVFYWMFLPVMFMFTFMNKLSLKFISILLFSCLGILISKLSKADLKFKNLINIGCYAITSKLIFDIIINIFRVENQLTMLISYSIFAVYFVFAIRAASKK